MKVEITKDEKFRNKTFLVNHESQQRKMKLFQDGDRDISMQTASKIE